MTPTIQPETEVTTQSFFSEPYLGHQWVAVRNFASEMAAKKAGARREGLLPIALLTGGASRRVYVLAHQVGRLNVLITRRLRPRCSW